MKLITIVGHANSYDSTYIDRLTTFVIVFLEIYVRKEKKMLKKCLMIVMVAILVMSVSITSFAGGWDVSLASKWAQPEIEEAYIYDLMPERLMMSNLREKITRAEFASLVVQMYQGMTGEMVEQAPSNTFSDTSDIDVLKANTLGIMIGSQGKANPDNLVTRQEMAVMYYRTLNKVYSYFGEEIEKTDGILTTNDKALIAGWAKEAVDYINENEIMKGSNGNFNPLDNAPIEQAIIVVKRVYENELDLIKGTKNIDLSKGYTYKVNEYGKDFTVTFNANGKSNVVKASEHTSLNVLENDVNNAKIYYDQTYDDSIDHNGVNTYSYDIATNEVTCLDDYFGYKVSTIDLIDIGMYKGYILVYPFEDAVNVYTDKLEFICSLEGMVTVENANTKIYDKLNKSIADDYTKGYTINDDGYGNISVTFNNSNNTRVIVNAEQGEIRAPNPIYYGRFPQATKDYSRIFFIATQNLDFIKPNSLCYYDFSNGTYGQIGEMSMNVLGYKLIAIEGEEFGQTYTMEYLVMDTGESTYGVYNVYGGFITNKVFSLDENTIRENLNAFYTTGLKMVMDGELVANSEFGLRWNYTKGKEWALGAEYATAQKDRGGPSMYANSETGPRYYQNDAVYECNMQILSDEKDNGNSGIMFNVESISTGNDNYKGYYVGIDLYKNIVVVGKSNYKWTNLKEFNIGDSIKKGDNINLKVARIDTNIMIYIDGKFIGNIYDGTYTNGGGMGFRSWNAKCNYYSLEAYPLSK